VQFLWFRIFWASYLCFGLTVTCWLYKKYWMSLWPLGHLIYATWKVLFGSDKYNPVKSGFSCMLCYWICVWCVTLCLQSVGATVVNLCYMVLMHMVNYVCLMNLILGIYCIPDIWFYSFLVGWVVLITAHMIWQLRFQISNQTFCLMVANPTVSPCICLFSCA